MFLEVADLHKAYGGAPVLKPMRFAVDQGEIVSFIGPSGAGKTTLLKLLAGLEPPDGGDIRFPPGVPSKAHPVLMVFQDYVLFPNLRVFDNVAFGLRARNLPKDDIRERVLAILDFFHLADRTDAFPIELSAGQKQRVAIARAMVVNPALLLLDEPFANLDRNLKAETAEFIRDTQKAFGVTTISVTHDLEEAFLMSDKVGIVLHGELVQFGPASEVYDRPATLEAARFLGPVNVFGPELCQTLGLEPPEGNGDGPCPTMYARPEAVRMAADPEGPGIIKRVAFAGHYIKYSVAVDGTTFVVYSLDQGYAPGQRVALSIRRHLAART